jgi:hypothetical protein
MTFARSPKYFSIFRLRAELLQESRFPVQEEIPRAGERARIAAGLH